MKGDNENRSLKLHLLKRAVGMKAPPLIVLTFEIESDFLVSSGKRESTV